jgi:hypothetical protein
MAHGVCEVLWVLMLFQGSTLLLYCDNKTAIGIANNSVQHYQTKACEDLLSFDSHFINGIICIQYVSSSIQVVDVLTKGLPEKNIFYFL